MEKWVVKPTFFMEKNSVKTPKETVVELIHKVLNEEGYELIDLIVKGRENSPVFQVFVDHQDGISIKDCSYLHRVMLDIIEMRSKEIGLIDFRLEVSSPGTDRSLKNAFDFNKNKGRQVLLVIESQGEEKNLEGIILKADEDTVEIQSEQVHKVPLSTIRS